MHAISQYRMIMGYADMVIWDACTAMAIWPAGMPSVLVSTHRTETYQPSSKTQSSATPSAAVSASVAAALHSYCATTAAATAAAAALYSSSGKKLVKNFAPGFCNLLVSRSQRTSSFGNQVGSANYLETIRLQLRSKCKPRRSCLPSCQKGGGAANHFL